MTQGRLEDQLISASALNLVIAAIVVWNTMHMERILYGLEEGGLAFGDDDLMFLSPLRHEHINYVGDFTFDFERAKKAVQVLRR